MNFGTFDKINGNFVLAGGTGGETNKEGDSRGNLAKIFDINGKQFVTFRNFDSGVICGNFSNDNKKVALGTSGGIVRVYDINLDPK